MEENLLIGDRLFVSKYSYGYSKHSFPFSPKLFKKRLFGKTPERGDVVVFKTPSDNRTDYIKRLIGLPGDKLQIKNYDLYINSVKIKKEKIKKQRTIYCGGEKLDVSFFEETLPNKKKYVAVYRNEGVLGIEKYLASADALITTDEFSEEILNIYHSSDSNEDRLNEISMKIATASIEMR